MRLYSQIMGANFRPAEAKQALREAATGETLRLEVEPENPFDPNAVALYLTDHNGEEHHVGYVARQNNGPIALALSEGKPLICNLLEHGGNKAGIVIADWGDNE